MKKRFFAVFLMILLLAAQTAFARNMDDYIDRDALESFADKWNEQLKAYELDIYLVVSDAENYHMLSAVYTGTDAEPVDPLTVLMGDQPPITYLAIYTSFDDSITLMISEDDLTEPIESMKVTADDQVFYADIDFPETDYPSFWLRFAAEDMNEILSASDLHIKLTTDHHVYNESWTADNAPILSAMLSFVAEGRNYSNQIGEGYLDPDSMPDSNENTVAERTENAEVPKETPTPEPTPTPTPKPTAAPEPTAEPHSTNSSGSASPTEKPTVPPSQPASLDFQNDYAAIDRAAKSVFLLEIYDRKDNLLGTGSGFVAIEDDILITNQHVVEEGAYVIAYSDHYENSYRLDTILAIDEELDIAIMEFPADKADPLELGLDAQLLRGEPVTAIGSPKGVLNTVSSGNISNFVDISGNIPHIQFTAPITNGSSGGALFNADGKVVGLCVSMRTDAQGMFYAVPIQHVHDLYSSAKAGDQMTMYEYTSGSFYSTDGDDNNNNGSR